MLKKKNARLFKKVFAILLAAVLLMGTNGSQIVLTARADGPEPGIEFWFDDRGKPDGTYVSVDGSRIESGSLFSASSGNTYNVQLTPPEERAGFTPIVDIWIYFEDATEEFFSSCPFWDGVQEQPANLTITEGAFDIIIPADRTLSKAVVNIWWSGYDKVGGSGEKYCVEVCINGCGEAYIEGIDAGDYSIFWEYTELDEESREIHSGAEKIVFDSSVYAAGKAPVLKFNAFEGNSFGHFQANLGEAVVIDAADLEPEEVPEFPLTQDMFDESNGYYVNTELIFDGGFGPSMECPNFVEILYNNDGTVDRPDGISDDDCFADNGIIQVRTSADSISFTLTPVTDREFIELRRGEGVFGIDDLTNDRCPFATYDDSSHVLTINFSEENEIWGLDVVFGPENAPGEEPSFDVLYDDHVGEVDISGAGYVAPVKLENGRVNIFTFGETYTFTLVPPENRQKDCVYIVEARIHNFEEPDTIYSNVRFFDEKAGEDADPNLTITNNQFSLEIPAEDAFCGVEIGIWWSEFDKICGWYDEERQEGEYCIQIRNDEHGEAFFENNPYQLVWEFNGKDIETGDDIGYGAQKYMVSRKDVEDGKAILKFAPYEGYIFRELEIEVPGYDPVLLNADDLTEEPTEEPGYQLKTTDFDEDGNLNTSVRFDTGSQPGEDITVFYRVEGDGTVLFAPDFDTTDNNGWKVGTLETGEITINVSPYEGCVLSNLKIDGNDFVGDVVNNEYSWELHPGENYVEIIFGSGNTPGGGGDNAADRLKEYIEGQSFLFGDWNEDGEVNEDDLKQGIAQQIFYPQFSDPRSSMRFGEAYPEIESYNDLVSRIAIIGENSSKNIKATAGNDEEYTISAYTYTFVFDDPSKEERNVNVEGTAWLFDFSDGSIYAADSVTDVLMEIKDAEGNSTYFLRNCGNASEDFVDPVTKDPSGEGACCAVGDYKVEFDAARNKYIRSVAIYGNGASLDDFLMTEDSETQMCTFQGRNEMLVRDAFGEGSSHPVIFGKFSFYKNDFSGMKIQGDGAAGNTPAWAFATDPIWGTAEAGTEKEAIVYFGNEKVYFSPITINGNVSDIADIKKTDASIPDGAVKVYRDGDKWIAEFFTNFYDKVEFTVTYETDEGPKTEYIVVNRVGIDIQATSGGSVGDKKTIFHGTEYGPEYTLTEECETIVYATYYYPEESGTTELVDLYATYTWKDGSVTKEVIHNDSRLHLDYHHPEIGNPDNFTDDVQTDDFILYEGSKAEAPQKIEVSAVVAGFDSKTSFSGMRLGSGKGVCWNNNIEN